MDLKKQYDKIGDNYISNQKSFFSKEEDGATLFIKKCLFNLKEKIVLDLGCGGGKDIKIFESLGAKSVYGVDSSKFMIDSAKKVVSKPANLFLGDFEKTPFEDKFFDVIIGRYSFHYLEKFDRAYKEISRVLKDQGVLILVVDHPLRSLIAQKKKIYGKQEIINTQLFDNKVSLLFPSHTFQDYLSKIFFNYFYLDYFEEGYTAETEPGEYHTPNFIGIKAIKR